jgi:hypothetical protein
MEKRFEKSKCSTPQNTMNIAKTPVYLLPLTGVDQ